MIALPEVPLKLATLADVRELIHKRLPAEYRDKETWRQVAMVTAAAARGQLPPDDVAIALRLVLQPEGIRCQSR